MFKRVVSIVALCASLYVYAMEQEVQQNPFNTFNGIAITPETIPGLIPGFLPQNELPAIRTWMNAQKLLLNVIVRLGRPLLEDPFLLGCDHPVMIPNFTLLQCSINKKLLSLNMRNLSWRNHIIEIEGTNYLVQIAGRSIRVRNLLAANNLPRDTEDDECDARIQRWPSTYQTVSRFAFFLRAKEAIEKFNLDKIHLPNTCIIGLYADIPERVTDDNSIVIQEKVSGLKKVHCMSQEDKTNTISPEHVRQIAILIIYASLWDLRANLLFDRKLMQFVYTDFEQPFDSNPYDFFQKNEISALGLSRCGLRQLDDLVEDIPALNEVSKIFYQLTDDKLIQIAAGTLPDSIATRLD